ncbi:MAG: hypothetical protein ABIF18_00975 [archaeon]
MDRIKQFFIFSIIILVVSNSVSAQDATSNRINGVAEFLLSRANDNFLFILQQDIEANQLMKSYLPETYKYATSRNLQLLLQSGPELWKGSVETDLKNFGIQLIFKNISPENLQNWVDNARDQYLETLQDIKVTVDGKDYPVTSIPRNTPKELQGAVNSFYDDINKAVEKIYNIIKSKDTYYTSVDSELQNLEGIIDNLKKQMARFGNSDVTKKASRDSTGALLGSDFYKSIEQIGFVNERFKDYKNKIDTIRSEKSLVVQMFKLDQLIRESIKNGENPLVSFSDMKEYNRFSNYALSFAVLSEAQSPGQVKSVMKQLTMPSVSFNVKREPDANKFMVNAYFGVQSGIESTVNDRVKGLGGLTVPVGFEYSHGLKNGGAFSVMLAPFDFANPVNKLLNNSKGSAVLKDIINPAIYISHGFKGVPVLWGGGISHGPSITGVQEGNTWKFFMFVGLDMPLLNIL